MIPPPPLTPPADEDDLRRQVDALFDALEGLSLSDLQEDTTLKRVVAWLESPLHHVRHETVRVYPDPLSDGYDLETRQEVRAARHAAQQALRRAGAAALPVLQQAEADGSQAAGALLDALVPARAERIRAEARALREQHARQEAGATLGPMGLRLWDLCVAGHGDLIHDRKDPFRRYLHADDLRERLLRLWGGPLAPSLARLLLEALSLPQSADLAVAVLDRCPPALHPRLHTALRTILAGAARDGSPLPSPTLPALLTRVAPSSSAEDRALLLRLGLHPAAASADRRAALAALVPLMPEGEAPQALVDLAFGTPSADGGLADLARAVLLRCAPERALEGLAAALDRQEGIVLSHAEQQGILALGPRALPLLPALLRSGQTTSLVIGLLTRIGASAQDIVRLAAQVAREGLLAKGQEAALLALLHASFSPCSGTGLQSPYGEEVRAALLALALHSSSSASG